MLIREVLGRLGAAFRRRRLERDLQREMRFHLEMLAEEEGEAGRSPTEAMAAAHRQFGNELNLRERSRETWGWTPVEQCLQDVRHAARALGRDRRFTAVAVLVLALGIAGNTTVFSLVNALVLNPFPYPSADRLVEIQSRSSAQSEWGSTIPVGDYGAWSQRSTVFQAMAAYDSSRANLSAQSAGRFDGPERIVIGRATWTFLRVLGVRPALGRFFTSAEDRPGGAPVVVLSHGAWKRRLGGRPDVLGQTLTLDDQVHTIVGVMPSGLVLPDMLTPEVWTPAALDIALNMQPGWNTRWDGGRVIARLKDRLPMGRAQGELDLVARQFGREHRKRSGVLEARLVPLGTDILRADRARQLSMLAIIVGTGLLLACVNLAGLLLARSLARTREAAVRSALGAGRLRLVRYALTEALLLSLGGGVLGLALTMWAIGGIRAAAPAYLGLDSALRIDGPVLAFALAASLLTGVAFGLLPALRNSAADPSQVLRGATGGHGRRAGRILSGLVVAEISLALLLLVGGSLMMRSFVHLLDVPLGLRPDGVLTFRVGLPGARYESADRRRAFHTALLERLERLPGATGAAGVSPLPMSSEYSGSGFTIVGRPEPADWHAMSAQYLSATPHYFRTMGIPVRLGREFEEGDGVSRQVVIVNEALVRKHFPGENPLGHVLGHGGTTVIGTIVGVVGDIRHGGPTIPPDPQIYYPEAGHPLSALSFVVRTTGDPMALAPLVRQQVQGLDPALPADRIKPMTTMMGETIADLRLITLLLSGFALFALALAAIGVYGVTSYSVRQRRYEIGVRIALGASPRRVLATVVARGAGLAAVGMAIGLPLALSATRLMATMLFGVGPRDARVFTLVPVVLLAAALAASYLPARDAAATDPISALRQE